MSYCDLATLKASVNIPADDTVDDARLLAVLAAADEVIDGYCERSFRVPTEATSRVFTASGPVVRTDDIADASSVEVRWDADGDGVYETLVPASEYEVLPLNAAAHGKPARALRSVVRGCFPADRVQVTAKFGWPETPASVREAARLQASRLWTRKDAPFGLAGSPEFGQVRLLAKLDADVEVLLAPYRLRKPRGLVSVRF